MTVSFFLQTKQGVEEHQFLDKAARSEWYNALPLYMRPLVKGFPPMAPVMTYSHYERDEPELDEGPAKEAGFLCEVCGFVAKTGGGLASHLRAHKVEEPATEPAQFIDRRLTCSFCGAHAITEIGDVPVCLECGIKEARR